MARFHSNRSSKGKPFKHKKGIVQFGIIAIALAIIVVGFLAFNPFKAEAKQLTEAEVKALIEKEKATQKQETQQPTLTCGTGTILQNNQCVTTNNGQQPSTQPSVIPTQPQTPAGSSQQCREPTGEFTRLYFRQRNLVNPTLFGYDTRLSKANVLGAFKYTGNCPIDIYVEAGVDEQPQSGNPLAIQPSGFGSAVKGSPSACDGNIHYNGVVFKQVAPNQVVLFELQPENYNAEGTYWMDIGAYTGCLKDGGKTLSFKQALVGFSDKYRVNTADNLDIHFSWVCLSGC